ncbi:hypothetical protein Bca4012_018427 [Brassica carinata]
MPLPNFVENVGDGENGGDMPGNNSILSKVESVGSSGEAALIADTDPVGNVSSKVVDPALQVVKKACMA